MRHLCLKSLLIGWVLTQRLKIECFSVMRRGAFWFLANIFLKKVWQTNKREIAKKKISSCFHLSRITKVIYKNSDGHENTFFHKFLRRYPCRRHCRRRRDLPTLLPTPSGAAGAAAYDGDDEIQIWKCNNNDFLPWKLVSDLLNFFSSVTDAPNK